MKYIPVYWQNAFNLMRVYNLTFVLESLVPNYEFPIRETSGVGLADH